MEEKYFAQIRRESRFTYHVGIWKSNIHPITDWTTSTKWGAEWSVRRYFRWLRRHLKYRNDHYKIPFN